MKILKDKSGWEFGVIEGDTHAAKWCEEQSRLDYDRSVEDVLRHIRPGNVVLDIGANIGAWTYRMAQAVGLTGKVVSFEANKVAFDCLIFNTRNLPQVIAFNLALMDEKGNAEIQLDPNVGASFIIPGSCGKVQKFKLDDLGLTKCDLIKMDIEGCELFAILGAEQTIRKFKPIVFTELNTGALARYGVSKNHIILKMSDMGYRMQLNDPKFGIDTPQLDVFFFPI